jgi:hypothetical protein
MLRPTTQPPVSQSRGASDLPMSIDMWGNGFECSASSSGMTQQRLAMLIGVSYQQQHKYELGADRITAGRLHAISRALDVDLADLFVGLEAKRRTSTTT